ncbi:MAG TPA: ABC transporter permease [Sporichthyaceae bacterium]|nr:ABC transporter permease [Sporichthyaceae bacterium]
MRLVPAVNDYLPFVVSGIVAGSLLGLAAVGLVLSFRTSGLFNFAHGAIAAAGAYVFYELTEIRGLPWPLASLLVLAVFAPATGLVLERMAAGLHGVRAVYRIVATVGLLLVVQGLAAVRYGAATIPLNPFLPQGTVKIGGTFVSYEQLIGLGIAVGGVLGLLALFRFTRTGLRMRAVVDNPQLLSYEGDNPTSVRRGAWVISSVFACATGLLLAPSLGLDTVVLALLVVQAFGAAAVGRFGSIGGTFVGGVAIGVASTLSAKIIGEHLPNSPFWAGIPDVAPFLVLFALLVVTPARKFFDVPGSNRTATGRAVTPRLHWEAVLALALVAVLIPAFVDTSLSVWTTAASLVVVFLGLGLMVWTSGQVSLAHAAFAAIGAAAMSQFLDAGLPWGLALPAAGLIAVPVAVAVALPTLRLSGLYLALATFAFAVLLQQLVYPTQAMFGGGFRAVARPGISLFGLDLAEDRGYYYLCVSMAALAAATVFGIQRARLGRLLQANAESADAVAANGGDTTTIRTAVFCVAGFLAAIGGALASGVTLQASSRGYGYTVGLTWVAVLALFGSRATVIRASAAAYALAVMPTQIHLDPGWYTAIFGAAAIAASLLSDRQFDLNRGWDRGRVASRLRRREFLPPRQVARPTHAGVRG